MLDGLRSFVATQSFHLSLVQTVLNGLPTEFPSPEDGMPAVQGCARFQDRLLQGLESPPVYQASVETVALAKSGGEVVPKYQLASETLPSPHGFVIFEEPVDHYQAPDTPGVFTDIIGIAWMPATRHGQAGVEIVMLSDMEYFAEQQAAQGNGELALPPLVGVLGYDGEAFLPFGELDIPVLNPSIKTIMSTWLLMQSRSIVELTTTAPPRRQRRRRERAGKSAEITVVSLRGEIARVVREIREAPDAGEPLEPDADGRVRDFRWPVSGHWRRWYFVKEQRRDLILIPPCIKGPEGAPLRVNKKLFRLMLDKPLLRSTDHPR